MKKKRSERKGRRNRDTALEYSTLNVIATQAADLKGAGLRYQVTGYTFAFRPEPVIVWRRTKARRLWTGKTRSTLAITWKFCGYTAFLVQPRGPARPWKMPKFYAHEYVTLSRNLNQLYNYVHFTVWMRDTVIPDEQKRPLLAGFRNTRKLCRKNELNAVAAQYDRLIDEIEKHDAKYGSLYLIIPELLNRLQDDLKRSVVNFIPAHLIPYYENEKLFGRSVRIRFPSAALDTQEAGKCLACGRYTACIFHMQRVLEVGLRTLGKEIGFSPDGNRTWDAILQKIDPQLCRSYTDKSEFFKNNSEFCAEAVAHLRSIKIAWRNPTMHVGNIYDEEKALELMNAVMAFMRHLATKLRE